MAEQGEVQQEQEQQEESKAKSAFWPDETVDAIAGFVIISALTLMALWYVIS